MSKKSENFYEGKFTEAEHWSKLKILLLPFMHKLARQRLFARYLKRGNSKKTILDIGCGGGNDLYTRFGSVWRVDVSSASLKIAKKIYPKTIHASADRIFIKDKCVDIVLSADLLGHLPPELKNRVLRESFRVLLPSGRALHYSEIKGNDIFSRWAKQYPALYKKYFIEQDGYHGLESIEELVSRFEKTGFKIIRVIPLFKFPFDLTEFCKRFDNEFRQKSYFVNLAVAIVRPISKIKPLKLIDELFGGVLADFISLFLPSSHAGGVFIIAER